MLIYAMALLISGFHVLTWPLSQQEARAVAEVARLVVEDLAKSLKVI